MRAVILLLCLAFGLVGCVQILGDFDVASDQDGGTIGADVVVGASSDGNATKDGSTIDAAPGPDGSTEAGAADGMPETMAADTGSPDGVPPDEAGPALCCVNATQPSLQYGTCSQQSPPCGGDVYCDSRGVGWNCWTHPAGTSTDPAVCEIQNCCSAFVAVCPGG
jgi:hypothetical protein